MSEEIKRCPFCGAEPGCEEESCALCSEKFVCVITQYTDQASYVLCSHCRTRGPVGSRRTAITDWNTRPIEDALQARVEALEAEAESGIRDWECLSCGWTYRGKDQCPKCGDTAHPLTTEREIAQEARIAALEAALVEIRDLIPVTHYELYEMADRALNGEVKE